MDLELLINNVDRTSVVTFGSISKQDNINERPDSLSFEIATDGEQTYKPSVGDTVTLWDGDTKEFAGVILNISHSFRASGEMVHDITCKDLTHFLDRSIVDERYTATTVENVIDDLIATYAPGFTTVNVSAPIEVVSITFKGLTVSQCLDKLAKLTNYAWYIDYYSDIHFFARASEIAPVILQDNNDSHIFSSLEYKDDISQMRNLVTVEGGEYIGNVRTDYLSGTGEQKSFPLAYKYATMPTVSVDETPLVVGVDGLTAEADADVFWSFQQKYLRFKVAPPATAANNIEIVGTPLYKIKVRVAERGAMQTYGKYEFKLVNESIRSREEALDFAFAQIQAYSDALVEGSFETYVGGFRSGQVVTIQSTLRGINFDVVIQSVRMSQITNDRAIYFVDFATMRSYGIINLLQDVLRRETIDEGVEEVLLSFLGFEDENYVTDSVEVLGTTTGPYKWQGAQGTPFEDIDDQFGITTFASAGDTTFEETIYDTGGDPPIRWNYFTWVSEP